MHDEAEVKRVSDETIVMCNEKEDNRTSCAMKRRTTEQRVRWNRSRNGEEAGRSVVFRRHAELSAAGVPRPSISQKPSVVGALRPSAAGAPRPSVAGALSPPPPTSVPLYRSRAPPPSSPRAPPLTPNPSAAPSSPTGPKPLRRRQLHAAPPPGLRAPPQPVPRPSATGDEALRCTVSSKPLSEAIEAGRAERGICAIFPPTNDLAPRGNVSPLP
ncbi:hypothetical protein GUJ93_ZPchr0001g31701 [Zizania palustris]|uniref:Uncharacterized protein n=1 Tax=Zizania palustris TaxID=103762 RepID=A0A8J5RM92_ZIZPA|nr:hypothetical protein GUJ93_ZPchr0001g31701 [Zizania palustris]